MTVVMPQSNLGLLLALAIRKGNQCARQFSVYSRLRRSCGSADDVFDRVRANRWPTAAAGPQMAPSLVPSLSVDPGDRARMAALGRWKTMEAKIVEGPALAGHMPGYDKSRHFAPCHRRRFIVADD
jgi:hypothetical protein